MRTKKLVMPPVIPLAIALVLATSGCATTGPADDGFENSNESIDIGVLDKTGLFGLVKKKVSDSIDSAEQSANQ